MYYRCAGAARRWDKQPQARYSRAMQEAPNEIDASAIALFLDVDGTLLDFRDHPDHVRSDPELIELLQLAERAVGGALSLVSGRSIDAIDRIFAPARFPAAGGHGVELRLPGGGVTAVSGTSLPDAALRRIRHYAERHGLLLEQKRGGVALHYRQAPELEADCRQLVHEVLRDVVDDFRLIDGKMVLELAPRGHDKGEIVRKIMRCAPYKGRRPVFLGDDITDEDAFRAVNALDGISIRVGSDQATAAEYRLDDVSDVHRWLHRIVYHISA